ncbi:type IV pilus assembly protein PilM [Sanguibacter keddieii DSM 10542]|uniref:Type IV pilus assembly protein PilM n=1 Tax=Sanguibacter keddieii (strain ATCC 51767 / DSM 10542 / NCFB 3025 / ST-74) TaxID=446469 RepID=D1BGY9_SANKS|nr:type IV pilus assembly protein PilM [Sanguibacter keddieii]ACZ21709.1 type IV pilus assembly protein PilM [Sanguibacter keddieii DSM 10542]
MAKVRTIGLDIGTSAVRAVEFAPTHPGSTGGLGSVVRVAEAPLPPGAVRDAEVVDPSLVSSVIKRLWSKAGFSDKNVIIGVGNQRVVVRQLDLPVMPMAHLRQALVYQAQETLPMAVDEALLDFYPTGEVDGADGRAMRGLFVAAVKDTVSANVLAVEGAGLVPQVVDLSAFALLRSVVIGDLAERTVACVDIGARVTNVVVADRGVPLLARVLAAGGQDATDAVARAMKLADADAERLKRQLGVGQQVQPDLADAADAVNTAARGLVEAVRNTLSYYASQVAGPPVEMLVLTGGGAHLSGLGQYLSSAARLPAVLGNSFQHVTWAKTADRELVKDRESTFAIAMGLAQGVAA